MKMTILEEIMAHKKEKELPERMIKQTYSQVQKIAAKTTPAVDLVDALKKMPGVALIAEIKKASPSKGLLRQNFNLLEIADIFTQNGAAAMSVLTDETYFQGSLDYLIQVRQKYPGFPLLQKDFIFCPYQIYEARAAGADAVLLILSVLTDEEMYELLQITHALGMTALIEVHHMDELKRALEFQPILLGVNNRNLHDFSIDINNCLNLRNHIPSSICMVAESGIRHHTDVERLNQAGVDAMLVGEAFAAAADEKAKVRELVYGN